MYALVHACGQSSSSSAAIWLLIIYVCSIYLRGTNWAYMLSYGFTPAYTF